MNHEVLALDTHSQFVLHIKQLKVLSEPPAQPHLMLAATVCATTVP